MSEKILLKVLKLLDDDRKTIAKERSEYIAIIKELTDKLYFLQNKNDYMINKTQETFKQDEVPATKTTLADGVPLEDLPPDEFEEAIANG